MASPASTSNIMLTICEKKTTSIDLYRPLRQFIAHTYSDREAQSLEDDLQTVNQLRADVERYSAAANTVDSAISRRELLLSYFKALSVMEPRFPISPDKDHINTVTFTWFDGFKQKSKGSQQNIHLEKAAILFNLGAVYSQIGLTYDRASIDGRRMASHAFMSAAGTFAYLRDNAATKASIGSSTTVDVSVECAGMLERLMLAQAQECVFENTIAKGSTPGVCSKISRQVGIYYEEAFTAVNVPPLNQHFDKGWVSHVQLKAALFHAEAYYRYSLELHEKEEIAEEIARLKVGISVLAEAKKSSKGAAVQLLDSMNKLEAHLNRNLERAMKENDRVYLMKVPAPSSLPPLAAFSLVKSVSMNEILDASKEKLFASFVPDISAKALSRYTEMVDDIIQTQSERSQQGSELARVRLKEMDLPDSIFTLEGILILPPDLKDDIEAVQICGGPAGLEYELQQLRDLRRVNQELLVRTEELLLKEAREDSQSRSRFRSWLTRPQSITLTKELQDGLNTFSGKLKQAADSDAQIERSVKDHLALMSILDHHPIEACLPTFVRPIMSLDANEDAIVGTLKQRLSQLETLGVQRAGLEDVLKEMKRMDDILPKLMLSTGSYEDIFKKEIAKYDPICVDIHHNLEAQEHLLNQIQGENEKISAVFNFQDYKASREKCYKQIQAAIVKFREIKENINGGMKFYVSLQDALAIFLKQNVKQQSRIEDVQSQVAGLTFQDNKKTGSSYNNPYTTTGPHSYQQRPVTPPSDPQAPYYRPPEQPTMAGYAPPPSYGSQQQHPQTYHMPQAAPGPYPPQQVQQQLPPPSHDYGQPAHPGWRGPYYNAPGQQQPGSNPRPPYTSQPPYPRSRNQGGNYK